MRSGLACALRPARVAVQQEGRARVTAARKRGLWTDAQKETSTRIATGLVQGNRFLLSKAITLAESTRLDHRQLGAVILDKALHAKATQVSAPPR